MEIGVWATWAARSKRCAAAQALPGNAMRSSLHRSRRRPGRRNRPVRPCCRKDSNAMAQLVEIKQFARDLPAVRSTNGRD